MMTDSRKAIAWVISFIHASRRCNGSNFSTWVTTPVLRSNVWLALICKARHPPVFFFIRYVFLVHIFEWSHLWCSREISRRRWKGNTAQWMHWLFLWIAFCISPVREGTVLLQSLLCSGLWPRFSNLVDKRDASLINQMHILELAFGPNWILNLRKDDFVKMLNSFEGQGLGEKQVKVSEGLSERGF